VQTVLLLQTAYAANIKSARSEEINSMELKKQSKAQYVVIGGK
jgi:hypothetical protein